MKTTLITNVYNEEFFIKPFLKHHVHLFDEGIIIDYKSTDKTIEIARKIAPHWKVVSPNIPRFHGSGDVHNIHHVERSVNGWKMSLNITEFLFTDDLKKTLKDFEKEHPEMIGIRTNGINIVDKIEDVNTYDDTIPLLLQKTHGYFETDLVKIPSVNLGQHLKDKKNYILTHIDGRCRLIHKSETSRFNQGRHTTLLPNVYPSNYDMCPDSPLMLCWFGYSPWNYIKHRPGKRFHYHNQEQLQKIYLEEKSISYKLTNIEKYKEQLEKYREFIKDIY